MRFKKLVPTFSILMSAAAFFVLATSVHNPCYAEPLECKKTATSIFAWGKAAIGDQPLKSGNTVVATVSKVTTYDGCVGIYTVDKPGTYGAMSIYGDDPTTPEQDGARVGDVIHFKIFTEGNKAVYEVPGTITWKETGEVQQFDIIVKSPQ